MRLIKVTLVMLLLVVFFIVRTNNAEDLMQKLQASWPLWVVFIGSWGAFAAMIAVLGWGNLAQNMSGFYRFYWLPMNIIGISSSIVFFALILFMPTVLFPVIENAGSWLVQYGRPALGILSAMLVLELSVIWYFLSRKD